MSYLNNVDNDDLIFEDDDTIGGDGVGDGWNDDCEISFTENTQQQSNQDDDDNDDNDIVVPIVQQVVPTVFVVKSAVPPPLPPVVPVIKTSVESSDNNQHIEDDEITTTNHTNGSCGTTTVGGGGGWNDLLDDDDMFLELDDVDEPVVTTTTTTKTTTTTEIIPPPVAPPPSNNNNNNNNDVDNNDDNDNNINTKNDHPSSYDPKLEEQVVNQWNRHHHQISSLPNHSQIATATITLKSSNQQKQQQQQQQLSSSSSSKTEKEIITTTPTMDRTLPSITADSKAIQPPVLSATTTPTVVPVQLVQNNNIQPKTTHIIEQQQQQQQKTIKNQDHVVTTKSDVVDIDIDDMDDMEDEEFGWNDDFDELDMIDNNTERSNDDNDHKEQTSTTTTTSTTRPPPSSLLLPVPILPPISNHHNPGTVQQLQQQQLQSQKQEQMDTYVIELKEYLTQLPYYVNSLNAVFNAEYNTIEKAYELQHYYLNRPELVTYTIEKEVHRMDYTVRMVNENTQDVYVTTNPNEIINLLQQHSTSSLCPRCCNQSILADMIQVMSGSNSSDMGSGGNNDDDGLIRHRYHVASIATNCHYKIDLTQSLVGIQATFDLLLPTTTLSNDKSDNTTTNSNSGRWKIGQVDVEIFFSCPYPCTTNDDDNEIEEEHQQQQQQPFVQYKIKQIKTFVHPTDDDYNEHLQHVAEMLMELNESEIHHPNGMDNIIENDHDFDEDDNTTTITTSKNFRDLFLLQTSTASSLSSSWVRGMQSALQDINQAAITTAAAGTNFIPDQKLLDQVQEWEQEEANAILQQQQNQTQQQQQQQQPTQQPVRAAARPTSILGGLVRSLAKSVALPEEDPSLYEDWKPQVHTQQQHQSEQPVVGATTLIPKLYNKMEVTQPPPNNNNNNNNMIFPKLYNTNTNVVPVTTTTTTTKLDGIVSNEKKSSITHTQDMNNTYDVDIDDDDIQEEEDGWGDDLDDPDLVIDDNDDVEPNMVYGSTNTPSTGAGVINLATVVVVVPDEEDDTSMWKNWVYDPVTEIIPTRKRWMNPIPGDRIIIGIGYPKEQLQY